MDFLKQVLGVDVTSKHWTKLTKLPEEMRENFEYKLVKLDEVETLFMFALNEENSLHIIRRYIDEVKNNTRLPVVVVLKKCLPRQRESLLKSRQPFVVEGKQIYLPFMGAYLTEKYDHKKKALPTKFTPSSQVVFFHYIYSKKKDVLMNDIVQALDFSAMSITRAVEQLETMELIKTYKKGVSKYITSDYKGKELFDRAASYMISPCKETKYVNTVDIKDDYPLFSLPALFMYNQHKYSRLKMYATNELDIETLEEFNDPAIQTPIEIWKYDPNLLADDEIVDVLSLYQTLKDDSDRRVQQEAHKLLDNFWKKYSFHA